jgi:hypothetical protein
MFPDFGWLCILGGSRNSSNGPGSGGSSGGSNSSSLSHHQGNGGGGGGTAPPHHNLNPRDLYSHQAINGYMPNGYALMGDPTAYSGK